MIQIGLTGAIGSGKSAVARKAAEELRIPVFDADHAVHRLYAHDKDLQGFIAARCGADVIKHGCIDREVLKVFMKAPENRDAWGEIEKEVRLRSWQRYDDFIAEQAAAGQSVIIADIPFLFESGVEGRFDYTINVSVPYALQKERALARETPKLTEADFEKRNSLFLSSAERNRKADFVIDNSGELAASLLQLRLHISKMRDKTAKATPAEAFNRAAVYVGSFDPMTLGHVDIVKNAANMPYNKLYVAIGVNPAKSPMFTTQERLAMIEREMDRDVRPYLQPGQEVIVTSYEGLTIDFMRKVGASLCVRGLRGIRDLEEEGDLAAVNKGLYADALQEEGVADFVQVYFATSKPELRHVSSSFARAICQSGPKRDLSLLQYVSADVAAKMIAKRDGASAKQ